jgi:P4 family phage/plasmid primase-like protien
VPEAWAHEALTTLAGAYAELSVSGTGIKVIAWCDDPPLGKPMSAPKGAGNEFHRFSHVQYLGGNGFNAVTGNTIAPAGEKWSRDQVLAGCTALGITIHEAAKNAAPAMEWDEATVREALTFIDPNCSRDDWIRIGMALRSGGGDADLWHEWSRGDLSGAEVKIYNRHKAQAAWDSFGKRIGVTLAFLYGRARRAGWQEITPGSEAWLVDHAATILRPRLRYIDEDKDWALWDRARWRRRSGVRARRLIHETNVAAKREILAHLAAAPPKLQTEILANARSAQTQRVAVAVASLLAGDLWGSAWDMDGQRTVDLLTFRNGMVDLRTGEMGAHNPELGFSRVVPYDYDPAATCPLWEQHVGSMFEDVALAEAFRMFVGYTVTGRNDAKVFGILFGEKDTGKSTTSDAIDHALGMDFAETVKRGVFMRQRSVSDSANSHDANVIALVGRRKLNIHEPDSGARWDEELVKQWTGGDGIALRRIYGETATFRPPGVIWALCNTMPKSGEFSDAFWSRALVFPCVKVRPRKEGFLKRMLGEELPGIGAWCVRAAQDYLAALEAGESPMLAAQKQVERQIVDARFGSNPLAMLIYDRYEADPAGEVLIDALVNECRAHVRANPELSGFEKPEMVNAWIDGHITATTIGRVLRSLGFETDRGGSGKTGKFRVARVKPRSQGDGGPV